MDLNVEVGRAHRWDLGTLTGLIQGGYENAYGGYNENFVRNTHGRKLGTFSTADYVVFSCGPAS